MSKPNKPKILIVGPAWVGDMVMAQTLFKLLRQRYPEASIDVLAPDWTRALLSRMPEVNQAISLPIRHGELGLRKRWQIGRRLKKQGYTQAYVLPNSWKSALIPFFAGIKKRTGWKGEMRYGLLNDVRHLDEAKFPLMIERFMALGVAPGEPLPQPYPLPELVVSFSRAILEKNRIIPSFRNSGEVDRRGSSPWIPRSSRGMTEEGRGTAEESSEVEEAEKGEVLEKPVFALCPGAAFGPSKRWPPEYFAEVANDQIKKGKQVWLFGSPADQPLAQTIQEKTKQGCVDLTGKTNLAEAIDLLSLAQLVVTNDSGLMHIAAALHRPLVAIYGSTSTDFTPPLGEQVKIMKLGLECSPCFQRECPLGHWRCMLDLKPQQVIEAIEAMQG